MSILRRIFACGLGIIILTFVIVWVINITYCEVLTHRFADENLYAVCNAHSMLSPVNSIKVLDFKSGGYAKIYAKTDGNNAGHLLLLLYNTENELNGNPWEIVYWDCVWANTGSADGFIWPYIR